MQPGFFENCIALSAWAWMDCIHWGSVESQYVWVMELGKYVQAVRF